MNYLPTLFKLMVCLAALLLVNCASMSKQECLNADWQSIGFEDGRLGYSSARIGDHRRACAKINVKPDLALYQQGYEDGARQFCEPQNGFKLGLRGGAYNVICPADTQDGFAAAYDEGKEIYRVNATLDSYQKNLDKLHEAMDANRAEKSDLEQQLILGKLTKPERIDIIRRLRQLEKEKDELRGKIKQHQAQIEKLQDNLRILKANSHFQSLL